MTRITDTVCELHRRVARWVGCTRRHKSDTSIDAISHQLHLQLIYTGVMTLENDEMEGFIKRRDSWRTVFYDSLRMNPSQPSHRRMRAALPYEAAQIRYHTQKRLWSCNLDWHIAPCSVCCRSIWNETPVQLFRGIQLPHLIRRSHMEEICTPSAQSPRTPSLDSCVSPT